MSTIHGDRIRLLMAERQMSFNQLLASLHATEGNERLARPNLYKIVNNSYAAEPAAQIVRGLALVLGTTADFLLGLSDERYPSELSMARRYDLVSEDTLLAWLAVQNAELADIMRAIRNMPEAEQQVILDHMASDIRFIRRMLAGSDELAEIADTPLEDDQLADADGEPEPESAPDDMPQRGRRR